MTGGGYQDLDSDEVSLPLGIFYVGYRHGPHKKLQINRMDNGGKIMEVGLGVALIGRASRAQIERSLFVQRYFNFAGEMLSTITAVEPAKEPTSITLHGRQPKSSTARRSIECDHVPANGYDSYKTQA